MINKDWIFNLKMLTVKRLSKECQKTVKKLSKECQKTFKRLSKDCQKTVKRLSKNATIIKKDHQKTV